MEPLTLIALLGAAAISSAGALYTNEQNIKYAKEANEESIALANTAHQREVRDLRAAGLNPILSATGSGSATPQLKVPGLTNPVESVGNNANSLANAFNGLTKAQVQTAQAELSSARSEAAMLSRENEADKLSREVENLENAATVQALTDGRGPDGRLEIRSDPSFAYGADGWNNLVQQKKNEIEQKRYKNSMEHELFNDVRDTVLGGVNSAAGFRKAGKAINAARRYPRSVK